MSELEYRAKLRERETFEWEIELEALLNAKWAIRRFVGTANESQFPVVLDNLVRMMRTDSYFSEKLAELQRLLPVGKESRECRLTALAMGMEHFLPLAVREAFPGRGVGWQMGARGGNPDIHAMVANTAAV